MNRKSYKISTCISAIIWAIFCFGAWYAKYNLGTVATLGGIALMFAWMYEQENISD